MVRKRRVFPSAHAVRLWVDIPDAQRRSDAAANRHWTKQHAYYDRKVNTRALAPAAFLRCEAAVSLENRGCHTNAESKKWTRCPLAKAPFSCFCYGHDKRWARTETAEVRPGLLTGG